MPALIIGILTPSVELIIGLVGSTIGVAICIMFPAACFIKLGKRDSAELVLAKVLLVFGFFLMVLGTYANLAAFEAGTTGLQTAGGEHVHNPVPDALLLTATMRSDGGEPAADRLVSVDAPVTAGAAPVERIAAPVVRQQQHQQQPPAIRNVPLTPVVTVPLVPQQQQQPQPALPRADGKPEPEINREAIAHEEHEIAVEAKSKSDDLQNAKELVQEIREEIRDVLAKQNEETQQLVLEKFEQIVGKVEHIEKVQEEAVAKKQAAEAAAAKPAVSAPAATSVRHSSPALNQSSSAPSKAASPSLPMLQTALQPEQQPSQPRVVVVDPIVSMIKKAVHEKISAAAAVAASSVPRADQPPAAIATAATDNVQEIPLQPLLVNQ